MWFRHARVAVIASVLQGSLAAAAPLANALEVDPTILAHAEPLHPLDHPNYASADTSGSFDSLTAEAQGAGGDVNGDAHDAVKSDAGGVIEPSVEPIVRDCAREALAGTAWDIWYVIVKGGSFILEERLETITEGCLKAWAPSWVDAAGIAAKLASAITNDAEQALGSAPDLYALADWLQVIDWYYVPA